MTQMFSPLHYITTLQLLLISFGLCAFCWTALYAVRKCEPLVVFLERGRLFVLYLNFYLFGTLAFYFMAPQAAYFRSHSGWSASQPGILTGWSTLGTIFGGLFVVIPMARRFNMGVCILIFNSWAVLTSVPLGVEPSREGFFTFTLLTFLQQIPYLGEQTLAVAALLECAPHGLEPLLLMFTLTASPPGPSVPQRNSRRGPTPTTSQPPSSSATSSFSSSLSSHHSPSFATLQLAHEIAGCPASPPDDRQAIRGWRIRCSSLRQSWAASSIGVGWRLCHWKKLPHPRCMTARAYHQPSVQSRQHPRHLLPLVAHGLHHARARHHPPRAHRRHHLLRRRDLPRPLAPLRVVVAPRGVCRGLPTSAPQRCRLAHRHHKQWNTADDTLPCRGGLRGRLEEGGGACIGDLGAAHLARWRVHRIPFAWQGPLRVKGSREALVGGISRSPR